MIFTYGVSVVHRPGVPPVNPQSPVSASSQAYGEKQASIQHLGEQRRSSCDPETTHVFLKQPQGQPLWWVHLPDGCRVSAASNQILHHWVGASHTLSKILLSGGIKKIKQKKNPTKQKTLFCSIPRKCALGVWRTESKINKKISEESNEKLKTAPCPGPCVLF